MGAKVNVGGEMTNAERAGQDGYTSYWNISGNISSDFVVKIMGQSVVALNIYS